MPGTAPEQAPRRAGRAAAVPSPVLVVGAVMSVQLGASLAKSLFDDLGPGGTTLLRIGLAAILLAALWRPRVRGRVRTEWLLASAYGLSLAAMNLSFYEALDRIPLGVAVTLEFTGPLAVAVAGSRRAIDAVWVALAAAGILALADLSGGTLDRTGMALALVAGAFWAAYIVVAARAGRVFPGTTGLALALPIATLAVLPFGVAQAGAGLLAPGALAVGLVVGILSSAIPYSLELEALRRLPQHVFGVLMSLEPAVAALAGLLVLGEVLALREWVGIAAVMAASAGATLSARGPPARD